MDNDDILKSLSESELNTYWKVMEKAMIEMDKVEKSENDKRRQEAKK